MTFSGRNLGVETGKIVLAVFYQEQLGAKEP